MNLCARLPELLPPVAAERAWGASWTEAHNLIVARGAGLAEILGRPSWGETCEMSGQAICDERELELRKLMVLMEQLYSIVLTVQAEAP
jgi:hypothetical protein